MWSLKERHHSTEMLFLTAGGGLTKRLTSKHHGFGGFKPWESFHRVILQVECVPDLGLLHILHPGYHVAHLPCEPTQQHTSYTKAM